MKSIAELLSATFIVKASIPSNLSYGTAIQGRVGIAYITHETEFVEAWAGGLDATISEGSGSRLRVTFSVAEGFLDWHCPCNPKQRQIFP